MLSFSRLKLHGFKSFVEPTELSIEPGMTGIVGPNGCGKSNLVEALRWVMGETSAKKMRGGEMDDVIFGGTDIRPSRNLAEVALALDNTGRVAAAEYNDADELQVARRIARGEGSDYRVNGRAVRQKDVQLLFADQATGAHSTSIVSQGQVGAIVGAKPTERRQILEEAAGITGLHARRHEAELRLKGAEANLGRVGDLLQTMQTQHNALQRQAKQAGKYRQLSEQIRKAEAVLLYVRWQAAQNDHSEAEAALEAAERMVRDLTSAVTRGNTERVELAAALPPIRQEEAAAAAALQRLIIAREALDGELARVTAAQAQQQSLLEQAQADDSRESALAADAAAALTRLTAELQTLEVQQREIGSTLPVAEEELAEHARTLTEREGKLAEATRAQASAEAERSSLTRQMEQATSRQQVLQQRRAHAQAQLDQSGIDAETQSAMADARAAVQAAEIALEQAQEAASAADTALKDREATVERARDVRLSLQAQLGKLESEAAALIELLATGDEMYSPLVDQVTAEAGYETALAAALGEALAAPLDSEANTYWQNLPAYDSADVLPEGAQPITSYIKAPAALARALAQIGTVADAATGRRLSAELQPGQILVSTQGDAWRWDGYTVKAGAPTASAQRLKQKNRLAEVKRDLVARQPELSVASEALTAAQNDATAQAEAARAAREFLQQAYQSSSAARTNETRVTQTHAAAASRVESLQTTLAALATDLDQVAGELQSLTARQADMPDASGLARATAEANAELVAERELYNRQQARVAAIRAEFNSGQGRQGTLGAERDQWLQRQSSASARQQELLARKTAAAAELERLAGRPDEIETQRRGMLGQLSDAEAARSAVSDRLATNENILAKHEQDLKRQEESLTVAREDRVRAEGAVQAALHMQAELRERMGDRLEAAPEDLARLAELDESQPLPADFPTAQQLDATLHKFTSDRDALGPVNLRAEAEAEMLQTDLDRIGGERDELQQAVNKLRQGIQELNREARQRLTTAFDAVNANFQELFVRLFGGGRAYLQLTEAEDALDAGLEIYASPPGKKLQILSLLSGGEKALTATALLFAVFLCNPSPICVLDEVDAPLDESNVGRFCDMVEEIARAKGTRFLIVTHHRLTMARMDRLYGVTMQERGVSSLMSVDLATAERYRETGSSVAA